MSETRGSGTVTWSSVFLFRGERFKRSSGDGKGLARDTTSILETRLSRTESPVEGPGSQEIEGISSIV